MRITEQEIDTCSDCMEYFDFQFVVKGREITYPELRTIHAILHQP
jgi:hypothetical protein